MRAAQMCLRSGWWDGPSPRRTAWPRRRRWRRRCWSCARASPASAGRGTRPRRSAARAPMPGPSLEGSSCRFIPLGFDGLTKRSGRDLSAFVGRRVDITTAVDRGLERKQQRAQTRGIADALEDLADGERTAGPRMLTSKRGRDPGAKRADGTDAIPRVGETISPREEVGRCAWTHGRACNGVRREMPTSRAEDDHRRGADKSGADEIEVDLRYLRPAPRAAAEQESKQVVEPILDPPADAVEQRRRLVQRVVAFHGEDLVKLRAGLRRVGC